MSVRKAIHDQIAQRLTAQNVYECVDMWKAQIKPNENKFVAGFPCAFVSVKNIVWDDLTFGFKEGTTTIEVFIFFNLYGDTFETATDKDASMAIIDVVEDAAETIHWLVGQPFSEITQTNEEDLTERYGRPAYKITFNTLVYKQINPTPHVPN